MFVLTVDQDASTTRGDLVPELLTTMAPLTAALPGVLRPFERTVGDEVQAVLRDADDLTTVTLALLRIGGWSIGIGIGPVHEPLPASSRAASGEAFVRARAAVERAKGRGSAAPVAVEAGAGETGARGREAEAVLRLLGGVIARRSDAGWEAIELVGAGGLRQKDVAARLKISEQAVSQRLRTALWSEEVAVRPVVARLLAEGDR
ncbi:hypothetical protein [Actinotalea sp. K2]|uniref:hypothetical protein n=1 Tax=Actinotalea sp. K2 TaxID=2939438 RepID=UPI00201833D0|nr:hypothetical protein [Actinotalea sp. K2]MCL3862837.1 hypothetical protein [Actinotalea sp. K2]